MPIGLVKDIAKDCPKNTRLLGVDLGTKTIGLAVCDEGQSVATALKTLTRKKFSTDIAELMKVVEEFSIGGFVFGWPLNMDGSHSASCDRVRSFIDEMVKYPHAPWIKSGMDVWIGLQDERLSTSAVHDFLVNDVDMSRTKRGQVVDKLAAQLILQGALEFLNGR